MEKVWLKNYQEGVPAEINPDEYPSLVALFEESCRKYRDRIAYVNFGSTLTYDELEVKSRQVALYLQSLGLKKGSRIALMMPNILQYPVTLFGLLRAGYVAVNTNPLYTPDEIVHQINDSGTETIIVMANFASAVEKALPQTKLKHVIVTELGDLFSPVKRLITNAIVKYIKKMVPAYSIPNVISYRSIFQEIGAGESLVDAHLTHQDIAFLQYTGGTTGIAKGAILTHGNMVANLLQAGAWIKPCVGENEIVITALPLYHIFSLTANCLTFLKIGAKNILITNPRDIPHFLKEISNSKFTVITGVNTLFNAMLNNPAINSVDFSALKIALAGGMTLQKSVAQRWRQVTSAPVLEAYGLTETCPAVTINPLNLKEYNGSIGLPISSTDISIRDEDEKELGLNETGELCIRGPQVMAGYWNRPDETVISMTTDGFLKSGDMAKVDENGFVYLVDRKKDMILVSGFNVYPNQIEQVISMMPGVLEVGVVGAKNKDSGEVVKACVVKKDPNLTEQDVINYCKQHLTGYKIPKIVEFYTELPKTNVGKILRRALRE